MASPTRDGQPRDGLAAQMIAATADDGPKSTAEVVEFATVVDLIDRLHGRVLDLEHRLAAAGVPHPPTALDRQRRRSRALLVASSPTARHVAQREEVLG